MESSNKPQRRSSSFPSRSTPSSSQIEINLNKFKTLIPFYSSTNINDGLVCLSELYLSIDELIGSSQIQQVNLQCGNKTLVEDALVGSIGLLDSNNKLMELLDLMKENARILQFSLRRKGLGIDAKSETHIMDYILSRKKARKNIIECLNLLEQVEKNIETCIAVGEDHRLSTVTGILQEIVIATISIYRTILICLSGRTKPDKGFSLIQKFIPMSKPRCEKSHEIIKEAHMIDDTLCTLLKHIKKNEGKTIDVQMVIERLQNLDCQIQGYEAGLDSIFRKIIKTRVSLLNILAN